MHCTHALTEFAAHTHSQNLHFILGPLILPLGFFMASKCALTINTDPWTRRHWVAWAVIYEVSAVSQQRPCTWAPVMAVMVHREGREEKAGGMRSG